MIIIKLIVFVVIRLCLICAYFNLSSEELNFDLVLKALSFDYRPHLVISTGRFNAKNYSRKIRSLKSVDSNLNKYKPLFNAGLQQSFLEIYLQKKNQSQVSDNRSFKSSETPLPSGHLSPNINSQNTFYPKADINKIKFSLENIFSSTRNSAKNLTAKNEIQQTIINVFKSNKLQTFTHKFTVSQKFLRHKDSIMEGINIIGMLPGLNANSEKDGILLIGAHYDTVEESNGVNDNGSGMAALLEIVRLISAHSCKFANTILFVAFDLEEYGGLGSRYFVNEYLIPYKLSKNKSYFQGAFILDTILNFNDSRGSQLVPYDVLQILPEWSQRIKSEGFAGDFIAAIYRNNIESHLMQTLRSSWLKSAAKTPYKLSELNITSLGSKMPTINVLSNHTNLLRSDHIMFWFHNNTKYNQTLKAILLTDSGPFRGYMNVCYHHACDNKDHIHVNNLMMMKTIVEAVTYSLIDLAEKECNNSSIRF